LIRNARNAEQIIVTLFRELINVCCVIHTKYIITLFGGSVGCWCWKEMACIPCTHICMYVCMYVYIYTHTHTQT